VNFFFRWAATSSCCSCERLISSPSGFVPALVTHSTYAPSACFSRFLSSSKWEDSFPDRCAQRVLPRQVARNRLLVIRQISKPREESFSFPSALSWGHLWLKRRPFFFRPNLLHNAQSPLWYQRLPFLEPRFFFFSQPQSQGRCPNSCWDFVFRGVA